MKLFILCLYLTTSLCQKHNTENDLWDKPCIDDNSVPSSPKSAEEIARYSKWTLEQLNSYKNQFILKLEKEHSTFKEFFLYAVHKEWLREFDWYDLEVLPSDKILGELLPRDTIEDVKARINFKKDGMTKVGATLKFLLSSFHLVTNLDAYSAIINTDLDFRRTLKETIRLLRSVTCSMNNYMKSKGKEIQVVLDAFLPQLLSITPVEIGLMFRDTINYLQYIKQLFEAIRKNEYSDPEVFEELDLWRNPCHYLPPVNYYLNESTSETNFKPDPERAAELAIQIPIQAKRILDDGKRFMDQYVKVLLSYPSFDQALKHTMDDEYLRKEDWYRDELLPKSKKLFTKLPESYIINLMTVFPEVLPLMHKALKFILSGVDRVILLHMHDNIVLEYKFKPIIGAYLVELQYLLCLFSDYLRALGLGQQKLFGETRISQRWIFVIFRDSLNYLDYLSQVFEYIANKLADGLDPFGLN